MSEMFCFQCQQTAGGSGCVRTGVCGNCHEAGCMCCNVVVTRHSRQAGRIKVILIAEDLGF